MEEIKNLEELENKMRDIKEGEKTLTELLEILGKIEAQYERIKASEFEEMRKNYTIIGGEKIISDKICDFFEQVRILLKFNKRRVELNESLRKLDLLNIRDYEIKSVNSFITRYSMIIMKARLRVNA